MNQHQREALTTALAAIGALLDITELDSELEAAAQSAYTTLSDQSVELTVTDDDGVEQSWDDLREHIIISHGEGVDVDAWSDERKLEAMEEYVAGPQ